MKIAYLTSGPRGAGKSTYANRIIEHHPGIFLIERDRILIEIFGSTSLNPYTGGHEYVSHIFFERVRDAFAKYDDIKLIIDYWNGLPSGRHALMQKLLGLGADFVVCLKFMTPRSQCFKWALQKEDMKDWYTESSCKNDYSLYHKKSLGIEHEGFHSVVYIDPSQLFIPGIPII